MSVLSRNVTLYCPICGNDQFSHSEIENVQASEALSDAQFQCADCKSVFTEEELKEANQEIINANIVEMKQELIKDFERKLRKALK